MKVDLSRDIVAPTSLPIRRDVALPTVALTLSVIVV
jgi:hypothetical protein